MQKNRLLSAFLIVVMLLSLLAGCSMDTETTPADLPADLPADRSTVVSQDAAPAEEAEESQGAAASADPADPAAAEDTASESDEISSEETAVDIFGEDETYENETFGFGFAPDGWSFYDDETLKAQTDASYVMAAANSAGETVSVAIQDTLPEHKGLSEEELYFLLLMTEQPKLQELGLPDSNIEVSTTQFLGKECSALHSTLGGAGIEQKQLYLVQDETTCVITVTSANEEAIDIILGLFHRL